MSKATVSETRFALAFLKALGASTTNLYLVTAVVAWLRAESGHTYIGNNPFNIRKSALENGFRMARNGNGRFSTFASLEIGAKATIQLLVGAGHDYRGYWRIVAAARRGVNAKLKGDNVTQGFDFLAAIAMSKWSGQNYGAKDGDPAHNRLVAVWRTITGTSAIPAEKKKAAPAKQKKKVPIPKEVPKGPPWHPEEHYAFLQPYAAKAFYESRNKPVPTLTGGQPGVVD